MTEPVSEISRVKETGRNASRGEKFKRCGDTKGHPRETENDRVDISEEASGRASAIKMAICPDG